MIPTLVVPEVRLEDIYEYKGKAKHTEEERIFQIYFHTDTRAIVLRDFMIGDSLAQSRDRQPHERYLTNEFVEAIIPSHPQATALAYTVWEHFKSTPEDLMTYMVHGIGASIDTLERFVLYSPRYERGQQLLREQGVTCLARPEEMFFSEIERDGYKGPRFRRIQ